MKPLLLAVLLFAICGCTASKQTVTTIQRIPATFDFSPPSRVQVGNANMTVALIRPSYGSKDPEFYVPPFTDMASSMAGDFEEMLTAKGFTIKGPYGSRDEMVYTDKVNSDFAFEVTIDPKPTYNRRYTTITNWGTIVDKNAAQNFFKMNGEVTFSGRLTITAKAPQYGEKLWIKNIDIQPQSFTYVGSAKWVNIPSMADELKQDNVVYNTVSRELEKYYAAAFNLCWQQIDPAEMKTIAAQAKRADKK